MSEGFGKTDWNDDKRLHIPFKDFINKVTTGKVYMTTQDIPLSEYDGGPIKRMGTHIQKLIDNKLVIIIIGSVMMTMMMIHDNVFDNGIVGSSRYLRIQVY